MRKPSREPIAGTSDATSTVAELLADPIIAAAAAPAEQPGSCVGVCVTTEHPTLGGRVEIEWSAGGEHRRGWANVLLGVGVRRGDRVLLTHPRGWPEPIVMGVLDGFAERPPARARACASATLGRGEHLAIEDSRGREVVRVVDGEHGPIVRLLQGDVALDIEGRLQIRAHDIRLAASVGAVEIEASHDIRLDGEVIHLN